MDEELWDVHGTGSKIPSYVFTIYLFAYLFTYSFMTPGICTRKVCPLLSKVGLHFTRLFDFQLYRWPNGSVSQPTGERHHVREHDNQREDLGVDHF